MKSTVALELEYPNDIVVDSAGNLFISDNSADDIREVSNIEAAPVGGPLEE